MKGIFVLIRLLIICMILTVMACSNLNVQRVFYIDSKNGDDSNTGLSPDKAWATLTHVNEHVFSAGDQVLIKSGTSYFGQLKINGKGSENAPIIVSNYGGTTKPVIHGQGYEKFTLLIKNSEYISVSNLKITNTGEERERNRTGVLIEAINYGDMHHIYLNSLDVHDVNGSLVKSEGGGSAIFWRNKGDSIPTRFVDLRIENCHLYRCGRNAITSTGNIQRDKWYPSLGVVIRGNLLEEIPGDGIVPIGCDGALIEYNIMKNSPDMLSHEEAAAGIWPWSCDNTIIQYNEVSGHKAKWDGQGYDSDFNCIGTTIRYNYSHDNNGGFLLVCNPGHLVEKNTNIGTVNSVVQYNLSINDGIRPYPTEREGWFSPSVHITGPVENTLITDNVFLIPEKVLKEIPICMFKVQNWGDAWPTDTKIENNHYFISEQAKFDWGESVNTRFNKNNTNLYTDRNKQTVLRILDQIISDTDSVNKNGYRLLYKFISVRLQE